MKTIIKIINRCLILTIIILLVSVGITTTTTDYKLQAKNLSTSKMIKQEIAKEEEKEVVEEEKEKETVTEKKEEPTIKEETKEVIIEEKVEEQPIEVPQNKTYTGKMSYYRESCSGCSGVTSSGYDVRDGRLNYYDNTYGQLRIVAAGREIPLYSVVKIKNSSLGSEILAIVLDRGGDIGLNRKFLIDMLTNNLENKGGVDKNITVEVLREGK